MSTKRERQTIYHTKRWRALRGIALTRDEGWCVHCRKEGRTVPAEIVHHKTPIRDGGAPWAVSNLESVCRACHAAEHAPEASPDQMGWARLVRELTPIGGV